MTITDLVRAFVAAELLAAPGEKLVAVDFVAGVRRFAAKQGQPAPSRRDVLFAAQVIGLPVGRFRDRLFVGNVVFPSAPLTTVDGRLTT